MVQLDPGRVSRRHGKDKKRCDPEREVTQIATTTSAVKERGRVYHRWGGGGGLGASRVRYERGREFATGMSLQKKTGEILIMSEGGGLGKLKNFKSCIEKFVTVTGKKNSVKAKERDRGVDSAPKERMTMRLRKRGRI